MEKSNTPSNDNMIIDAKPFRTLAPMFPAPLGLNTYSIQGGVRPFICVNPFDTGKSPAFPPPFTGFTPRPEATNSGESPMANGLFSPSFGTPISMAVPLDESGSRSIKRPINSITMKSEEKSTAKRKGRPPKKVYGHYIPLLASSSHDDPRESVEVVLMTFDALRRRLLQLDEASNVNRRPDLKASNILMGSDLRANKEKRIGTVPGVEVGDIFYFRMEMCLVGLHAPSMGGIDYMTARFDDGEDPVAICVVSAGGYENEEGDADSLVYSGQGGVGGKHDKKQTDDQKLERGNLALERSLHRGNQIRVVRSAKDFNVISGKIYIYDGIYKIQRSWVEKGKSGFNIFKYKLAREPEQPQGFLIWKMTQRWKENPASRGSVILPDISSGVENIPVCLVNDVDHEKGPSHFTYTTSLKYVTPITTTKSINGCLCLSVCLPGDTNCSCARGNGGDLPYSSTGFLVSRKSLIYECNTSCQCSINCRNRVTQKGIKLHFEVFRTRDRGWGLRSWDPIRAGTFICEYSGEVINKREFNDEGEENEYIFQTTGTDSKTLKWNYGPELLGEASANDPDEGLKNLPIVINAKNMGNISRFMNHSCSPNILWQPVLYDHGDERYPHIMFFAIKHIPPMTELTYDYGLSGAEHGSCRRTKKCVCESSKCRGFFG